MQANIQGALKEFKKLLPAIKQQISGIQKEFDKSNIKDITANVDLKPVQKQLKETKKQIKEAFDPNDISGLKIHFQNVEEETKKAKSYLEEYHKEMSKTKTNFQSYDTGSLQKYINDYAEETQNAIKQFKEAFDPNDISGLKIHFHDAAEETKKAGSALEEYHRKMEKTPNSFKTYEFHGSNAKNNSPPNTQTSDIQPRQSSLLLWDTLKAKIQQIKPAIQQFKQSLSSTGNSKELELLKYKISEVEEKLEQCKKGEIKLSYKEILQVEAELEKLNTKKAKLESGGKQNVFLNMFSNLKKMTPQLNGISSITVKIKNQIKQMSTNMKQGLGHVLKYAGALFSLRSIYSTLSSSAQSWLSSQNVQAQQLSANIEYMKYAMR